VAQTTAMAGASSPQSLVRTDPTAAVTLPADSAPHDVLTEWWYYTGHLRSDDGQRFGFEFVIFQTIRGANPIGYLSHFAVTDEARGRFVYDARSAVDSRIPPTLDIDVGGWTLAGGVDEDRLNANTEGYGLELVLSSEKAPALHGGGLISFGPAGDSYYFSRTRMTAIGRLRRDGAWSQVTGQAWHDHQWGNFIVPAVGGWDWISVQLDGNRELMLTVLRAADGSTTSSFGSYVDASGQTVDVPSAGMSVGPIGSWTSPKTGATYPSGWRLTLDASPTLPAMALLLAPVLIDQELAFDRTSYWEGAVDVAGTVGGVDSTGQGYVELTGYQP
jgi:predicted secreted hydrolase